MTRVNFLCAMFKAVYSPLVKTLERKVYSWLAKALALRRTWEIRDHKCKIKFERRNIFRELHFSGTFVQNRNVCRGDSTKIRLLC